MKKTIKRLLLGLIIWGVPFFSSFFVWDIQANAPRISETWFNALMAFAWAIGFAIAAFLWFKNVKKDSVKDGINTGLTWYLELILLDYIILVKLFGMATVDYYPMLLTYLNSAILCITIGYVMNKK